MHSHHIALCSILPGGRASNIHFIELFVQVRVLDANMKKRDSFLHHWFFDYTLLMLETISCWLISCSVVSAAQHSAAKEHIHSNNDENTIDSWWWCWRVIYIFHQFCNRKRKNNSLFDVHHNCILHEQLIQKFKHQGASRIKERAPLPPPPPHTLYNTNSICFCAVFLRASSIYWLFLQFWSG